ncbi:MAG: TRAP transporter large permease subunit [Deltaproteobacteria bacterium]|nr:TRAP transporter large permease subunit [Candidatus Anaeroferrophillacea bacterium]
MIAVIAIVFTVLLLIGVPIAAILLAVTGIALHRFTWTPLLVLPQQLFNALDNFVLLAVPFFILASQIMTEGAMADRLVAVIRYLVGRVPGGLAIAGLLACIFFAALSGSSPATVIAIGSIMIPALRRAGYDDDFAVGLITSAGSLGVVIPPSIPMILYCLVMNVSVAELFLAGIGPGLLVGAIFTVYILARARRHQWREAGGFSWSVFGRRLREGIWGMLLPLIVLGGIYSGIFTPTEAAAVAVVYAVAVEFLCYRELTFARFNRCLASAAVLSAALLFILAAAMTFVWLLTAEGIPAALAAWLTGWVDNRWLFLLLINLLFLALGSVMDNVSAMLILSPLLADSLDRYGIDLIHYGIIMVMVIEIGFLTPPFGLNLFVAMGLTGRGLLDIGRAVLPFLLLLLLSILLVTCFPTISLWLPAMLR